MKYIRFNFCLSPWSQSALRFLSIGALLLASALQSLAHADVLQQRHEAFESIEDNLKIIKQAMKNNAAPDSGIDPAIVSASQELARHGTFLLTAFDQESYEGDTRARKRIWKHKEDFDARLNAFNDDLQRILQASAADDLPGLKEAMGDLSGHCRGCHMKYREWW